MTCIVIAFFKDDEGIWHQPGDLIELPTEQAALWKSKVVVKAYQTRMTSPPETRVVNIPKLRRRHAVS